MKVLVIGSNGFIGNAVVATLSKKHQVFCAARQSSEKEVYKVDLTDKKSIGNLLDQTDSEVIINCAGVVENSEKAMQNVVFTKNLLEVVVSKKRVFKRIIISGSASVYGVVATENIPVSEDAPLNANSGYGLSKLEEEKLALEIAKENNLPVIVARIFNPIGSGMHNKFLVPKIIDQVNALQLGGCSTIEVSRLDSKRDYINVLDVATAYQAIIENSPKDTIYNVGTGVATSNGQLIQLILDYSNIASKPMIVETSKLPEALVAIQADISRINSEFGWKPVHDLTDTVKGIINDSR